MKNEKARQIARLLVMGHTDKVIAEQLGSLLSKLGFSVIELESPP